MSELKVEYVKISDLMPCEQNPRRNDENVKNVVDSMHAFGWTNPILARRENNMVIAGHTRLKAAIEQGMKEVPVVYLDLDETDAKTYMIADNKLTECAEWDFGKLTDLFVDLDALNVNLDLTGFDPDEIANLLEDTRDPDGGLIDDDEIPEMGEAVTKDGDLWILGEHRLLCGDSTKKEDVERLMGGEKAILMNTDPPYGIDFVALAKSKGQSKKHKAIANDDLTDGEALQDFLEDAIRASLPHLEKGTAFYLWHPMLTQGTFFAAAAAADILVNRQIIWVKPAFVFGRGDYHWRHELCFYGWIKGDKPEFYGERNQDTIWEIGRENDGIHPTQKPVELFTRPIENHTKRGQICYEPFAGSGTQLIACEKTGRKCYGMEIDKHYCDVIVNRWQEYTGKKAHREDK